MSTVEILLEVRDPAIRPNEWILCFQKCIYHLDDDDLPGYRFIWRRPDGSLQAARGQARIPEISTIQMLTTLMQTTETFYNFEEIKEELK